MEDKLFGKILPDGSVQITTGQVSAPNHTSAEDYLDKVSKLTGGKWVVKESGEKPLFGHHHHGQAAHEH